MYPQLSENVFLTFSRLTFSRPENINAKIAEDCVVVRTQFSPENICPLEIKISAPLKNNAAYAQSA